MVGWTLAKSKIHLIGIGGVGMAGLAVLLKAEGHTVSGCDLSATPRTRYLTSQGIEVLIGHDPNHVRGMDEVIITPAVHPENPERCAAARIRFRGEVLAELVSRADAIAVCGSHGKTTTSTFIAKLLKALGARVSWAIGGETGDFPVAHAEPDSLLVVEADESDGTLAHYHARTLVVTNCEYDHPDHFRTREAYFACYETAKRQAGEVIESERLTDEGLSPELLQILNILPPHNRQNARAAVEIALRRGYAAASIARVLPEVVAVLPDRRFERLWPTEAQADLPQVITDYAHHPTEMGHAVQMARRVCMGRLRVLFQPHRYSRTKALLNDFPASFAGADEVILCPTYAAFESPIEGGDIADLYRVCRGRVPQLYLARACDEAWEHAFLEMQAGDVTLLLGAGDIIKLAVRVQAEMPTWQPNTAPRTALAPFSFFRTGGVSVGGGERHIMGMGSNTWISDLTTRDEYVRLTNPADVPGAMLGIPWMAGIPGTLAGWVKMNAGAFGHEISEVVARVKVDGVWLDKEACGFGYRTSTLQGVIEEVELNPAALTEACAAATPADCLKRRKAFPPRCCGSVFKNPTGDYAGRLLEAVGAKELSVGGARVWAEHANVIFAEEGATASDILALAQLMRTRVQYRLGVTLEPEIQGLVL